MTGDRQVRVSSRAKRRPLGRLVRGLGYFVQTRRDAAVIVGLAGISFFGTLLEASALGLIAPTALAIVGGDTRVVQEISFLSIDIAVGSLIGVIAVLLLASGLFQVAQAWIRSAMISRVEIERRRIVIATFLSASWEHAAGLAEGTLQQVIDYVRHSVAGLGILAELVKSLTSFAVMVTLAVLVDVRAAVGIVVVVTLLSALLYPFSLKLRAENRQMADSAMQQTQLIGEIRRTSREIIVFAAAEYYLNQLDRILARWRRHRRRANFFNNVSQPLYQYIGMFTVVIGLFLLSTLEANSATSASVSALLLLRSIGYGQSLQSAVQRLYSELPYAQRAAQSRARLDEVAWITGGARIDAPGVVDVREVSYRYPGADALALDDVSLSLPLDQTVGLVGPSGSGKSTLAQVLLRLRIPHEGRVLVDGQWAEDVTPGSWFRVISYVPQNPVLVRGTLFDNVAMHRPWVDEGGVRQAIADSGLDDLLALLDGKLTAKLGPGGRDLSGGQLQRLGIARALAGQPRWIILDEPTSALDLSTEAIVQQSLGRLKGRVGLVIIAHRLSTLNVCDRLVVLEDGSVQFDGPAADAFAVSPFLVRARQLGTLDVDASDT